MEALGGESPCFTILLSLLQHFSFKINITFLLLAKQNLLKQFGSLVFI